MFKRDITTFPSKFETNKMDTFWRNLTCKSGSRKIKEEIVSQMILPNIIKFKEYVLLILHKFFQSIDTEGRL